jgi:CRP-like cAMP-binding protein
MDRRMLERRLAQAQDYVGEAQRIIERLRPLPARLSRDGQHAATGSRLLATLEDRLRRLIEERDRLAQQLSNGASQKPRFLQSGQARRSDAVGGDHTGNRATSSWVLAAIALLETKFKSMGVDVEDLGLLVPAVKYGGRIAAGADIMRAGARSKRSTLLVDGVACLYKRREDGTRQIYAFKYPGDFCDLDRFVLRQSDDAVAVQALSECSLAALDHDQIEHAMARSNALGLALWRSTMLDTSILREHIVNVSRLAAIPRVAHLLCEQLARREAINLNSGVLPFSQVDLADAAGLSPVHVNRTIQTLRKLNVLSSTSRAIEVVDRKQLASIGHFDGRYLNMPQLLSNWRVSVAP